MDALYLSIMDDIKFLEMIRKEIEDDAEYREIITKQFLDYLRKERNNIFSNNEIIVRINHDDRYRNYLTKQP